jgi:glycine oxidase
MLSPYAETSLDDAILIMSQDALKRWKNITSRLVNPVTVYHEGSLLLAPFQEHEDLIALIERSSSLNMDLTLLSHQDLEELEPELPSRGLVGLLLPNEGYIDTYSMMVALENTLREKNVTWMENTKVIAIKQHVVYTLEEQLPFDQVFDCRSLGAQGAFEDLRSVKGDVIWIKAPHVNITHPIRFLHNGHSLYLVPRADNHYIIGGTCVEEEGESPITVHSTLELLAAVKYLHPEFANAQMVYTATQCRAAFNNNQPKIIKTPDCVRINGLYRYGYLLAPKLAAIAAQYLK